MVMPLGNVKYVCSNYGLSEFVYLDSDDVCGKPEKYPKYSSENIQMNKDASALTRVSNFFFKNRRA